MSDKLPKDVTLPVIDEEYVLVPCPVYDATEDVKIIDDSNGYQFDCGLCEKQVFECYEYSTLTPYITLCVECWNRLRGK